MTDSMTPHTEIDVIRRHLMRAFASYAAILGLDALVRRDAQKFIEEAQVPIKGDPAAELRALQDEMVRVKHDVADLLNAATKPAAERKPEQPPLPPLAPGADPEDEPAENASGKRGLSGREMERAREMALKGVNSAQIARIIGRPHSTVRRFVRRLENAGVVEKPASRLAHERAWVDRRARSAQPSAAVN